MKDTATTAGDDRVDQSDYLETGSDGLMLTPTMAIEGSNSTDSESFVDHREKTKNNKGQSRCCQISWILLAIIMIIPFVLVAAGSAGLSFADRSQETVQTNDTGTHDKNKGHKHECFQSNQQLVTAVHAYLMDPDNTTSETAEVFGHPIGKWCVSQVTDFSHVFSVHNVPEGEDEDELRSRIETFNHPLHEWDTSSATTMAHMFNGAKTFDRVLADWNVSAVRDFSHMFQGTHDFNRRLASWDVSKAKQMKSMFESAKAFEGQGLEEWDTSEVHDMTRMFASAHSFAGDVSPWNVHKVESMAHMFQKTHSFSGPLTDWHLSPNLRTIEGMFQGAIHFHGNLEGWGAQLPDTKITSFKYLFRGARRFNKPLDNWDTSRITDMTEVFRNATSFNQPLGSWNVSNVMHMDLMFHAATNFNQDLSSWEVSSVQSLGGIFVDAASFDQDLCSWSNHLLQGPDTIDDEAANVTNHIGDLGALTDALDSMVESIFVLEDDYNDESEALENATTIFAGTSCPSEENPTQDNGEFSGPFCHSC